MINKIAIVFSALGLVGCATDSSKIASVYVSPTQYRDYDCDQLNDEADRLRIRASQLGANLDSAAANDKTITGVGAILFWPALFALGGNKQQEAEYSRLKGETEAVSQMAVIKKCAALVQKNSTPSSP